MQGKICFLFFVCLILLVKTYLSLVAITCPAPEEGTNTEPIPADAVMEYMDVYIYDCLPGYSSADRMSSICTPDGVLSMVNTPVCNGQ